MPSKTTSSATGSSNSLLLALDTSTRRASVALCAGELVLAEADREVTTHSEGLLPLLDQVLGQAARTVDQLDAVVCGQGPGSFTGLRIGMATAKGLCLAADKPLLCVSSLLPLGLALAELAQPVAAVLDARRKELFCALYRGGEPQGEELLLSPAGAAQHLARACPEGPLVLAGDGAVLYQELLLAELGPRASLAAPHRHQVHARHLARAALPRLLRGDADELLTAEPRYLRPSDAKLPSVPQRAR